MSLSSVASVSPNDKILFLFPTFLAESEWAFQVLMNFSISRVNFFSALSRTSSTESIIFEKQEIGGTHYQHMQHVRVPCRHCDIRRIQVGVTEALTACTPNQYKPELPQKPSVLNCPVPAAWLKKKILTFCYIFGTKGGDVLGAWKSRTGLSVLFSAVTSANVDSKYLSEHKIKALVLACSVRSQIHICLSIWKFKTFTWGSLTLFFSSFPVTNIFTKWKGTRLLPVFTVMIQFSHRFPWKSRTHFQGHEVNNVCLSVLQS